ncbi:hypothetical protein GWK47_040270 [Chionoecetes opilio]|uniref:Uncharacterized protein n=1 Tax=Chionoecetes opilio TaxID=41210 RepID=A0A8J5CL98_CHIOP|nr:hypothetical protein GWK47_040270 [Chionoecetes opilio]
MFVRRPRTLAEIIFNVWLGRSGRTMMDGGERQGPGVRGDRSLKGPAEDIVGGEGSTAGPGYEPRHQAATRVGWAVVGAGAGFAEVVVRGEGLPNTFPPQEFA